MKRLFMLILIFAGMIMTFFMSINVYADDLKLVVNGKEIQTDVPPKIMNNRTLVPIRVLTESMGANVEWNGDLRQVVVISTEAVMIFTIDSTVAYINSNPVIIDAPPVIINNRTLVPLRVVSENLNYNVEWEESTRTVYVSSPGYNGDTDTPEQSAPSVGGVGTISAVDVSSDGGGCSVSVSMSQKTEPSVMRLSSPDRIVFDFYNINQACNDGNKKVNNSVVSSVRWAEHEDYTRLVIETTSRVDYTTKYTSSGFTIIVGDVSVSPPNTDSPPAYTPPVSSGAPIVVIDAGHGGADGGAVGEDEQGNKIIYEKEVNLKIALRVESRLKAYGVTVLMTRNNDTTFYDTIMEDLVARADFANKANADLFVSIHNDAFSNPEASGSSVLYAGLSNDGGYGITSHELAKNILGPLVKATGLRNRGTVESPNIVVLKRTSMPAALVECAFVTCPTDQKVLMNEKSLDKIADAICEGIVVSLRKMGRLS